MVQFVTIRLADSLPLERRLEWRPLMRIQGDGRRQRALEDYLDSGRGACWLNDPRIARLAEEALLHFDGEQYRLLCWVVMPNHVHVVLGILPGFPLASVMQSRKTFVARRANATLGRSGRFWQPDFFDRFVRDDEHFERTVLYTEWNPVKAGLVGRPEDWPYGSARMRLIRPC